MARPRTTPGMRFVIVGVIFAVLDCLGCVLLVSGERTLPTSDAPTNRHTDDHARVSAAQPAQASVHGPLAKLYSVPDADSSAQLTRRVRRSATALSAARGRRCAPNPAVDGKYYTFNEGRMVCNGGCDGTRGFV